MKRLLLVIFLFCSLCILQIGLNAQTNVSMRAGLNLATLVQNSPIDDGLDFDIDEFKFATNFHLGVAFDLPFSYSLMLQAEVLYNLKGTRILSPNGQESKLNLTYLSLPLLLAYRPHESIRILFGPEIDYLLGASQSSNTGTPVDATNAYEDFAIGITLGVAYHMESGLNIGIRGHYGGTSVRPALRITGDNGEDLGDLTSKNMYFSLAVGYSL